MNLVYRKIPEPGSIPDRDGLRSGRLELLTCRFRNGSVPERGSFPSTIPLSPPIMVFARPPFDTMILDFPRMALLRILETTIEIRILHRIRGLGNFDGENRNHVTIDYSDRYERLCEVALRIWTARMTELGF